MPQDHWFKRRVRARMRETGENYLTARSLLRPSPSPVDSGDRREIAVSDVERQGPQIVDVEGEKVELIQAKVAQVLKRERKVKVQLVDGQHHWVTVLTEEPGERLEGPELAQLQREIAIGLNDPGVLVQELNLPEFEAIRCSFCGKPKAEVERLVTGPKVYICDACVDLAAEIVAEGRAEKAAKATS